MEYQRGLNNERAQQIAGLNDVFRRAGPSGGDWYVTPGTQGLNDMPGLIEAVIGYTDFSPDIDPHGEHDMGKIIWDNEKTYFKIDYYDQQLQYWCDPLLPECRRVLTVLLAEEY